MPKETKTRTMRGPGGGNMRGRTGAKPKNAGKTIGRILAYMGKYKAHLLVVALCVVLSVLASVAGTAILRPIINDYITPLIGNKSADLGGLARMMLLLAAVYGVGVLANYCYQRIMVSVSVNTLSNIRKDLFDHMQALPIRYFDTHTHGELMSRYTNDVDTLRQLLSQSLVQLFSSSITVVSVFVMMLIFSPLLTLVTVAML
ncbi:ABC transporter ATP-binding protein, partial [Christensenellaceae bacterium OttesenSCG-928-L17]|nr:ABC transporter ATP-binding protein [Christensenellaceae bacterium OttesenSCG-928-L17]